MNGRCPCAIFITAPCMASVTSYNGGANIRSTPRSKRRNSGRKAMRRQRKSRHWLIWPPLIWLQCPIAIFRTLAQADPGSWPTEAVRATQTRISRFPVIAAVLLNAFEEGNMRRTWIIPLFLLTACSSAITPQTQPNWARSDGTPLSGPDTQKSLALCANQMGDTAYATGTPDFNTPESYQRFNEQFQNSAALARPSSAEINTCMQSNGYQPVP